MYDRGNYGEAIERSIRKLEKDPHDGSSKKVLQDLIQEIKSL
jgi:hypothetical protein